MKSAILLLSILAAVAWGYVCTVKLESVIKRAVRGEPCPFRKKREAFKIMLENPIMADSLLETIKKSKSLDEFAVFFYTGTMEEIREQAAGNKVDMAVFLHEPDQAAWRGYSKKKILFSPSQVRVPAADLPVDPVSRQAAEMYVIWNNRKITDRQRKVITFL